MIHNLVLEYPRPSATNYEHVKKLIMDGTISHTCPTYTLYLSRFKVTEVWATFLKWTINK